MRNFPFVNDSGDLFLHAEGSGVAEFEFETAEGELRDMRNAVVLFKTRDFEKELTNGEQPHVKVLTLLGSEMNSIIQGRREYIIVDTSGAYPVIVMEADIIMDRLV